MMHCMTCARDYNGMVPCPFCGSTAVVQLPDPNNAWQAYPPQAPCDVRNPGYVPQNISPVMPPVVPYCPPPILNQAKPYNKLAIAGFVIALCSVFAKILFFAGVVGLILSIIGLVQIQKTAQRGKGMAIAGIAVGSVMTFICLYAFIIFIFFMPFFAY